MKATLRISVLLLFTSIFLFSCKDEVKDLVNTYINSMSGTVNGTAFTSANTDASKQAVSGGTQLTITGRTSTNQLITIAIKNYTGVTGSFTLNGASGTGIAAYNTGVSGSADVIATSGAIVIASIDTTSYTNGVVVNGTFNFTAGTYTVTGTFSVFVGN